MKLEYLGTMVPVLEYCDKLKYQDIYTRITFKRVLEYPQVISIDKSPGYLDGTK